MINEFAFNELLRQIVEKDFEDNQKNCADFLKVTKQDLNNFYRNRKRLGFGRFRKWADKAGYTIKIKIEKKTLS